MHPRDLGPYALHMQRLIVLAAVIHAIWNLLAKRATG